MFEVKKAKRQRRPLKISLEGLSGSGKTYSALRLAFAMRRAGIGKRIVVADSENESAGLYDGVHIDGETWQYDVCPIPHEKQNPAGYTECYEYLVAQGYDLVIFDSLSHAWHGAMEQVDAHARANRGDKLGGWAKVTPDQRTMLSTLTDPRAHLIATMRVKSDFQDQDVNGKTRKVKVGVKTDQRDNTEYEFDCVVRLDAAHEAVVEKVRGCSAMDHKAAARPGPDFWKPLFDWWLSAEPVLSPEDDARRRIAAAADLPALAAVWQSLPADLQKRVAADKDRRKAELTPAAPAVQPPPPKMPGGQPLPAAVEERYDPDEDDTHGDDDLEWEALDTRLGEVCEQAGTSPADAVRKHAAALGVGPKARPTDLGCEELRRLIALVEGGGALFAPGQSAKDAAAAVRH